MLRNVESLKAQQESSVKKYRQDAIDVVKKLSKDLSVKKLSVFPPFAAYAYLHLDRSFTATRYDKVLFSNSMNQAQYVSVVAQLIQPSKNRAKFNFTTVYNKISQSLKQMYRTNMYSFSDVETRALSRAFTASLTNDYSIDIYMITISLCAELDSTHSCVQCRCCGACCWILSQVAVELSITLVSCLYTSNKSMYPC